MNKIIALVGMCGSGKSVACNHLISLGYEKVYFGGVTMSKLKEEGLEVNPQNEKYMREKLRQELGMGAYAIILSPQITKLVQKSNVVLDGLYSWDELKILQDKFAQQLITIAIVVDKKMRYKRLSQREERALTPIEAAKRDIAEIENIAKAGPIAYADYYINNNLTPTDLKKRINTILKEIEDENE